ncbi:MAG: bifunctional nuclease family protein [Nitrospiraceae bacterium]|nr:MAG: bifunctional nuclease family protein [Nitrospiraceae bacterium]
MVVEMRVEGLLFDPRSNMYILLLKELDSVRTLPIWIGKPEADSIALALGKVATPRPLTHDLIKNITDGLKVNITKIVITEIIDNTYYAFIYLNDGKKETLIDSRPSDAVAIALRVHVPIFVDESLLGTRTADELDEWLKNLRPEDFGNIM